MLAMGDIVVVMLGLTVDDESFLGAIVESILLLSISVIEVLRVLDGTVAPFGAETTSKSAFPVEVRSVGAI